ncbi:MAG TPA: helix-turn-helix domain-containing protein [Stenotrophomonas sp.]|nr:helix-turn-helix domain-containing protein [Stenotrophomonas sp.]
MENIPFRAPDEVIAELGDRLKQRRLADGFKQVTLADKAGVSRRAIVDLEAGRGSSLETLVRVLKALGLEENIAALVPVPRVSPMAMARASTSATPKRGVR